MPVAAGNADAEDDSLVCAPPLCLTRISTPQSIQQTTDKNINVLSFSNIYLFLDQNKKNGSFCLLFVSFVVPAQRVSRSGISSDGKGSGKGTGRVSPLGS